MKKQLFFFLGLCMSLSIFAQDKINLVIFAEDGDPFYAFVNGVRQNNKPETNVKVTDVSPNVSLRVEFENKALPQLKQTMPLDAGFEHTMRIKRDMKKQLKLRYFGSVPLAESQAGIPTVAYHVSEEPSATYNTAPNTSNSNSNSSSQVNANTTITTSTTTTTKNTSKGSPNSENASVNISMGGVGISMNVNGMGQDMDNTANINTTTSTTVTTTQSSSGSNNTITEPPVINKKQPATTIKQEGCSAAMSPASFSKMKQAVESKPFSDTKMSTAKIATKNGCVSANQVMEICKLFSMDDDKLVYAKYAYDYCVDKANYYTVSEVFSFSSTTDDFNTFLEKH
jgi:Domain of unknown function (DUF4476)